MFKPRDSSRLRYLVLALRAADWFEGTIGSPATRSRLQLSVGSRVGYRVPASGEKDVPQGTAACYGVMRIQFQR
jgi:hypothetical protein